MELMLGVKGSWQCLEARCAVWGGHDRGIAEGMPASTFAWSKATVSRSVPRWEPLAPPITPPKTPSILSSLQPPELLRGGPMTHEVDVWSFGTLLWEMCAGKRAWDTLSYHQVLHALVSEGQTLPVKSLSGVPPLLQVGFIFWGVVPLIRLWFLMAGAQS